MNKFEAIQMFLRVAETGSFSAVAKELGKSQSTVSKNIAALENKLGALLLSRTTRSISLTEDGQRYFEEIRRLMSEFQDAESILLSRTHQVSGNLKIAASVGFGRKVLMHLIADFLSEHPDLNLDLNLNDGWIDIVEQGVDVAIRIGDLPDSSLLAKKVGVTHRAVVASSQYLRRVKNSIGIPQIPSDLLHHQCIIYTELQSRNIWEFTDLEGKTEKVRVTGNFQSNSSIAIYEAGLRGMGICYSPTWLFEEEIKTGEMKILLKSWAMRPLPINAMYPPQRKNSAKVKAFVDYLSRYLELNTLD